MNLPHAWAHGIYLLAWLSFGAGHSFLAGRRLQALFGARARLAFNVIALIHFGIIFEIGVWAFAGLPRFAVSGWGWSALTAMAVGGWALLFLALGSYDLGKFSGLAQIRAARAGANVVVDDEPLITQGFHAYVRHPLYSAAILILWGAAWNDLGLATAVWGSLYLLIGSRFEERRLARLHGDAYRTYRKKVPAFLPWRGKVLR